MTSYAKLHRIAIRVALCLSALGGVPLANAAYAQIQPPSGWAQGGNATATYQAAANERWLTSTVRTNAALNVGGRVVQVPATMRLAANAPRIAAAFLFANPALRTAVGVASWLGVGKMVWDAAESAWKEVQPPESDDPGGGYEFRIYDFTGSVVLHDWTSSPQSACGAYAAWRNGQQPDNNLNFIRFELPSSCIFKEDPRPWNQWPQEQTVPMQRRESQHAPSIKCPTGWTYTPAGCLSPAVTRPQFEDALSPSTGPSTMPDSVPNELPRTIPWPVQDPAINPGTDGKPAPLFIPTGNPIRNPQYNPNQPVSADNQPYVQPGIRVVPAPVTGNPWQVDIQPINRPVPTSDPNPNPVTDQPTDNDKPREDDRDLCQRNPDILACAKPELDTPDGEIPKTTKDVSYQPESLFGGGSCPANKVMSIHGQQITVWDWDQSCGWITGAMRPIVLVLSGFAAFVIVSAGAKS